MGNRRYNFASEKDNEIYETLKKDFSLIKEADYGFINKKITSAWLECESNYGRFNSILERLIDNKIIDRNIEAIVIEVISKFNPVKSFNDLNSEEKIERVREVSNKRENELRNKLSNMERIAFILGFILFIIILRWAFDGSYCSPEDWANYDCL